MSMGMCFFFLFFFTSQFINKIQKQSQNLTPTPTSFSQVKQKNCPKSCCSVTAGNVEVKFLIWDASSFVLQYWNSGRSHFRHEQPVLVWPIELFLPYFLSFGNLILQVSNSIVRGSLKTTNLFCLCFLIVLENGHDVIIGLVLPLSIFRAFKLLCKQKIINPLKYSTDSFLINRSL